MRGQPRANDLWGKFRDEARGGPAWHPLVDHCTDVACVLEALLRQPTINHRLAHAGGIERLDDVQVAQLCYLSFLHDLGKCSLGFRAKAVPELGSTCGHLSALRPLWHEGPEFAALLQAIDADQLNSWAGNAAGPLLLAVFAHHGRTPELGYSKGSDAGLLAAWTDRQREPLRRLEELAAAGRRIFAIAFDSGTPQLPAAPAFQHLFAGLLMLADWLGSSDEPERFPFTEAGGRPREAFARRRAPEVLRTIGLASPAPPAALPRFEDQFPFSPRGAQRAMDQLQLPDERGSVVLLESETGSGKTEAALRWASRLIDAGLVDGCFFAVPLRSAAAQLHRRMQGWLDQTYGRGIVEALLAVPGYFRMGEAEGSALPDFRVQWTDDETTDRRHTRWAAEHPKRYAAASFAVGTIDQALLGVLQVRHAHLRAACLARHLLVIDEVHASDAYMTALTERLLALFRVCGGHVLLMSATLGGEARARLVDRRPRPEAFDACVALPYPRIGASHTDSVDIEPDERTKRVEVLPLPFMGDAAGVAACGAEAVAAGARVLILRNTVRAAIETQAALEEALTLGHAALFRVGSDQVATLHHGRFAAEDRRLLDEAVERRFGKDSKAGPAVIVATQTLEQSLDVDSDLLITDLCPADVLLQRIGRLHRHPRSRPPGYEVARCLLLGPKVGDLTSRLRLAEDGIGPERAYDNVLAVEATRQLVGAGARWVIPADNRRLVEEGTHPERLLAIARGRGTPWLKYWQDYTGKVMQNS